ncbi:MAG: PAS domain S-box protein [Blastocatellia bacterium]|nr:PAS domain S-box protein [Blastocatellia bacterium]
MSKALKVLIVEDLENDALLVLRELKRNGYDVTARRVDTAFELRDALDAQDWDIVIADYALPGMGGLAALAMVRERGLGLPFIIVSGAMGEDAAVAAMKAGAQDCISKDSLARLVPAVERELREAEDRRRRSQYEAEREVFYDIVQGTTATTNLDELLGLIHQSIKKVLYAENCFVALYNPKTETFSFPYFVDEFDPAPPLRKMKKSITDYVFRTGRPLLSNKRVFSRLVEQGEVELVGTMSETWLGVPLKTPHETIGVLAVQHYTDEHAYTERHLKFLMSVGGQVALAIERKRSEEALRASEDRYRDLVEHSHDLICTHDLEGRILSVNRTAVEILGYDPDNLPDKNMRDILAPEYRQGFDEYLAVIKRDGVAKGLMQVQTASGERRIWEYTNTLRTEGVEVPIVREMAHDITEHKRVERALRISEQKYKDIFEFAPIGIYQSLRDGTIRTANRALARMLGYGTVDELLRVNLTKDVYADAEERDKLILEYETAGYVLNVELQWKKKDGTPIWISLNAHAIKDSEGRTQYFEGFVRDITESKRTEKALRAAEEKYRSMIQNAVYGIYLSTPDGRLLEVNQALVTMLGYESAEELLKIDLSAGLYCDPDVRARLIEEYCKTGIVERAEVEWKRKDGTLITVRLNGQALNDERGEIESFEMIVEDVTELRLLEEQLNQAQKMEAIGRLAGGVAHDFNNLLTAINGYAEMMLMSLPEGDPMRQDAEEITKAGHRAAGLTNQLLAFSRKQTLQPRVLDLNEIIDDSAKMLRRLIGEDIEMVILKDAALGRIKADPVQMEQVIMNLAVNARDAMIEGGKLHIETANVYLDEDYKRVHVGVQSGPYVMLAVTDNGCGMDEETRSHIFEPFFTTKEKGRGTGLGLSTIYGIVRQSGGYIDAQSQVGRGAAFRIYLPRVETPLEVARPLSDAQVSRGVETILLVEDEDIVRHLARDILKFSGYTVLEAANGGEALSMCQDYEGTIDLMLTDVVMPKMSGPELARRLAAQRPMMKAAFMSGYNDDTAFRAGLVDSRTVYIQKPFTPNGLANKVREALDK